jgi:hypothetical protein
MLCALFAATLAGQEQSPPLDGPNVRFQDQLLDKLAGHWQLTGAIMGRPANHSVDAEWVLNHQFLRIHELGPSANGQSSYEALVFVGYDHTSERYVAHWIDIFGGRTSETLGYGKRMDQSIVFVFEYPDGPFHTTFRWDAQSGTWNWLMQTKDKTGKWVEFGNMNLSRSK